MELIALDRSGGTASLRSELEHELAALRMQAAAMTAQWQAEQEAISSIRQIKEELTGKRAEAARWERAGDLARR